MNTFEELVNKERERQDRIWGEQNHDQKMWLVILVEEIGEMAKAMWRLDLFSDPKALIEHELVQCAAVLKAMWESGKRNSWL